MRMPRARLTVRGMMIAVAVAALGLAALIAWVRYGRLADHYRNGAAYFARREAQNRDAMAQLDRDIAAADARGDRAEAARLRTYFAPEAKRWTEWHGKMRRHYEHAASHPWEPLPPDLTRKPFPH